MRPALKSALFFAITWSLIKMGFFYLDLFQDDIFIPGLINNLFLLAAISIGLYYEKKREGFGQGTALSDIKHSMIAGAPYALLVAIFMYFYYTDINPDYVETRISDRMDLVYNAMERESYVDSLKIQSPEFKVLTNEEIYSEIRVSTVSAYSPKALLTFSLLGLMILGFTYSIFITVIFRKILLRDFYSNSSN
jgi:hypothetical protein